jgi:type IV secretion system protein VirB9
MTRELVLLAAALLIAGEAPAAVRPSPGMGDPRVKAAFYEPGEVYEIEAALHVALTLEFGEGERIENVAIGDALGRQVTPNRRANLLFVKPLSAGRRTNMTVITNLRRYQLTLRASAGGRDPTYVMRFLYPEPARAEVLPPPARQRPRDVNHADSYSGAAQGLPTRVFDDGKATYFTFADIGDLPAVYVTDARGAEALGNVALRDGLLMIDQVAAGFTLRRGREVTRITNGAYRPPAGGGLPATAKQTGARK